MSKTSSYSDNFSADYQNLFNTRLLHINQELEGWFQEGKLRVPTPTPENLVELWFDANVFEDSFNFTPNLETELVMKVLNHELVKKHSLNVVYQICGFTKYRILGTHMTGYSDASDYGDSPVGSVHFASNGVTTNMYVHNNLSRMYSNSGRLQYVTQDDLKYFATARCVTMLGKSNVECEVVDLDDSFKLMYYPDAKVLRVIPTITHSMLRYTDIMYLGRAFIGCYLSTVVLYNEDTEYTYASLLDDNIPSNVEPIITAYEVFDTLERKFIPYTKTINPPAPEPTYRQGLTVRQKLYTGLPDMPEVKNYSTHYTEQGSTSEVSYAALKDMLQVLGNAEPKDVGGVLMYPHTVTISQTLRMFETRNLPIRFSIVDVLKDNTLGIPVPTGLKGKYAIYRNSELSAKGLPYMDVSDLPLNTNLKALYKLTLVSKTTTTEAPRSLSSPQEVVVDWDGVSRPNKFLDGAVYTAVIANELRSYQYLFDRTTSSVSKNGAVTYQSTHSFTRGTTDRDFVERYTPTYLTPLHFLYDDSTGELTGVRCVLEEHLTLNYISNRHPFTTTGSYGEVDPRLITHPQYVLSPTNKYTESTDLSQSFVPNKKEYIQEPNVRSYGLTFSSATVKDKDLVYIKYHRNGELTEVTYPHISKNIGYKLGDIHGS